MYYVYICAAAEQDPLNRVCKGVGEMCRDLRDAAAAHLNLNKSYYGGLGCPVLRGSDEFSALIKNLHGNYFQSCVVSVDFSGN